MKVGEKILSEIEKKGIQKKTLATDLGISEATLYNIFKSDDIALSKLKAISKILGLSPSYFIDDSPSVLVVQLDKSGNENIVMVPIKAQAGYLNNYDNQNFIKDLEPFKLPMVTDGTHRAFEIEGDSMYPNLCNGDWVVCRFTEKKNIRNGLVYIVVTKNDGLVCKRLYREGKTITLFSFNQSFGEYDLELDVEVMEVWEVKLLITKSFTLFGEMQEMKKYKI